MHVHMHLASLYIQPVCVYIIYSHIHTCIHTFAGSPEVLRTRIPTFSPPEPSRNTPEAAKVSRAPQDAQMNEQSWPTQIRNSQANRDVARIILGGASPAYPSRSVSPKPADRSCNSKSSLTNISDVAPGLDASPAYLHNADGVSRTHAVLKPDSVEVNKADNFGAKTSGIQAAKNISSSTYTDTNKNKENAHTNYTNSHSAYAQNMNNSGPEAPAGGAEDMWYSALRALPDKKEVVVLKASEADPIVAGLQDMCGDVDDSESCVSGVRGDAEEGTCADMLITATITGTHYRFVHVCMCRAVCVCSMYLCM
jgi:hypothetical protein